MLRVCVKLMDCKFKNFWFSNYILFEYLSHISASLILIYGAKFRFNRTLTTRSLSMLRDMAETYSENFDGFSLTKFNGEQITVG